jgi:hypothetical protein
MTTTAHSSGIDLMAEVTCPNCWEKFPPESALAVAGHGDLTGDPRLEDQRETRRFVPTRFTPECAALDEKDTPSLELACPHCHLLVPRVIFERRDTVFLSIFGRSKSGKSYFLAAMARQMETALPQRFGLGVTQPHPASNALIQWYKNRLFNNPDPDALVDIPATEVSGIRYYQRVRYGNDVRQYPRPMFFQVTPTGKHPHAAKPSRNTRTICLYDNSGEHFRAGHATPNNPETEHLCRSSALLFVFDPTREPAFIERCRDTSNDPQFAVAAKNKENEPQDVILATADANVKKRLGREIAEPLDTPLVVILAKFDAWRHLVTDDLPAFATGNEGDFSTLHGFKAGEVERVSGIMRDLLLAMCPSIVATAERFSRRVCYIPTSATGCTPIVTGHDPESGASQLKVRRGSLRPIWAEVPLLWILDQLTVGLVPTARPKEATR